MTEVPTLDAIQKNLEQISQWIVETPVWHCRNELVKNLIAPKTEIFFKLELFQKGGSFKARGALSSILHLDKEALKHGVVAASAGNHAIAVSYAAKTFGTSAKVIMPRTASPVRIERCKKYGAEVILVDSMAEALAQMPKVAQAEQRTPVHPFEGPLIVLGTGTIGLELMKQIENLDAVVVPIGGGGLIAGIATTIKQMAPQCQIFGVEPEGAATLYRSLAAGKPVSIEKMNTIADSLACPHAMPYSFSLCEKFVDEVVLVNDAALMQATALLFNELKLAVEPAAAASTAALCGPLKERLEGKRVALIISGTNIDIDRFSNIVKGTI
jgi:threonine dehydratase